MYISMSHLRIPPDQAPELLAAFADRAGLVERHDGFIDLEVWHSDRDPGVVVMVSRWRERGCFTAYMRSADHAASHGRIAPGLQAAIRLQSLDHLHTVDVAAK